MEPSLDFDSLVQTATGFKHAGSAGCGGEYAQALPMQILDHASGYLMAVGAQVALAPWATEERQLARALSLAVNSALAAEVGPGWTAGWAVPCRALTG